MPALRVFPISKMDILYPKWIFYIQFLSKKDNQISKKDNQISKKDIQISKIDIIISKKDI